MSKRHFDKRKTTVILSELRWFLWQREKDSNPHIQSQSLLCYLYTNPLYSLVRVARTGIIIPENKNLSRFFLKKIIFVDFSRFQGIFPGKPPLHVHHQKQTLRRISLATGAVFTSLPDGGSQVSRSGSISLPCLKIQDYMEQGGAGHW